MFEYFAEHEIGRELRAMSQWLDQHRDLLTLVMDDLRGREVRASGRDGMSAESVVRCALLKQYRPLSYEELASHTSERLMLEGFTPSLPSPIASAHSAPIPGSQRSIHRLAGII